MNLTHKLGFWSVFALVTGSQIGSGVFMLPAALAPYGWYGLLGWLFSGIGAIMLALVFAALCQWFPKTGGPHVYVNQAFGNTLAFFTGWTYWIISWISTTIVIIASIGYLTPVIGIHSSATLVALEIILIVFVTLLNYRGVTAAGHIEFILTLLKIIPLCIIPLGALYYFNSANVFLDASVASLSLSRIISSVTLLTLWGFIGLESATTPAESVINPSKTIPRAIITGTACVVSLYLFNSIAIMGIIPGPQLMTSNAPYADAARIIFGGNWFVVISVIASIICIGTLNAWTLTSGQIALGLAQDELMPAVFARKNLYGAPYWSLTLSCLGIIPLLILTANQQLAQQVLTIIDFSVTAFVFVYALCCISFLKILVKKEESFSNKIIPLLSASIALLFCCWILYETPLINTFIAVLFMCSGIPVFIYMQRAKGK